MEVLNVNDKGVQIDFKTVLTKDGNTLRYYYEYTRPYIKKLFPESKEDKTSVINGSVLDPEIEQHNFLFHSILEEFEKFGPLKNIDPAFKSRLYEKFLKKPWVRRIGVNSSHRETS